MAEWLQNLIPNVMQNPQELVTALRDTLIMVSISGGISLILGVILGVVLVVTRRGGVMQHAVLFNILDKSINLLRSIPFIILLAALYHVTRGLMGTAIGIRGAIVPLVFGTVPFFSRQIETALLELDNGLIEAAQAMGTSPWGIIFRVYLRESIPGMVRATMITFVSLLGLSAMAGAVGAGGLGDYAIRLGYQRFKDDVTWVTVLLLLALVSIIQALGNWAIRRTHH